MTVFVRENRASSLYPPAKLTLFALAVATSLPSTLCAQEPRETGLNELVVIRPDVDDKGLPPVKYNDKKQQVEIPPIVHVHRYYYSGDKEYQGPIVQGGPTVVVGRHPYSNEQFNVEVMLPAGAPLIAYNKNSITYIYDKKRVVLGFSRVLKKRVKVSVQNRISMRRKVSAKTRQLSRAPKNYLASSSLARSLKESARSQVNIAKGAVGFTRSAASFVVDKGNQAINIVPGAQMLKSLGERANDEAERERIKQASLKKAESVTKFIRSNR